MKCFENLQEVTTSEAGLGKLTSLGIGGTVQVLISPRSLAELREALHICHQEALPIYVIGAGSNILVRDEPMRAAVLKLPRTDAWRRCGRRIEAAAGVLLPHLVRRTTELGLSGLEGLAGVPGTLGGAIACNAATRYCQMGELVERVTLMTRGGNKKVLTQEELEFGYRHSSIDSDIVLEAVLKLAPGNSHRIRKEVARVWEEKRSSQPLSAQSAGCVFKNPPGEFAGELIEEVGLKGRSEGQAQISPRHANFIINQGGASARDVLTLINLAREKVRQAFDIELELEIDVWPRNGK